MTRGRLSWQRHKTKHTREPRPGVYSKRDSDRKGALEKAGVQPDTLGLVGTDDTHVEEHVVDVREDLREADRVDEPDEAERQELSPRDRCNRLRRCRRRAPTTPTFDYVVCFFSP